MWNNDLFVPPCRLPAPVALWIWTSACCYPWPHHSAFSWLFSWDLSFISRSGDIVGECGKPNAIPNANPPFSSGLFVPHHTPDDILLRRSIPGWSFRRRSNGFFRVEDANPKSCARALKVQKALSLFHHGYVISFHLEFHHGFFTTPPTQTAAFKLSNTTLNTHLPQALHLFGSQPHGTSRTWILPLFVPAWAWTGLGQLHGVGWAAIVTTQKGKLYIWKTHHL